MQVHHILKSKATDAVVTVAPGTSISDVAKVLAEKRIGTVVVSNDGETTIGVLSERDIVRELAERGAGCLSETVDTYMTSDVVTCSRHDEADVVLTKMTEGRFRHMPVMEGAAMVGLISIGDVVKAQLAELSMEKAALEGMIKGF